MRLLHKAVFGIALALTSVLGFAQNEGDAYPTRPIRWIVPYTPGGTTDILARLMAQWLSERLGQQVVVENKPGGGNNIGTEMAVRAQPDGYTIFLVNPANGINATLYKNLKFNFLNDMDPVAGIIRVPNVMTVRKDFPAKNIQEFIDYARKNPGKVNMASSGTGTSVHLSGELFKTMTGVDMKHIPYKGAAPATQDLLGGQVDLIFDNMPSMLPHIKAGAVRALGVTTTTRSAALPDVPAISEVVPGYEASAWFGASAPKGTPRYAIDKLNRLMNAALADPAMQKRLADLGGVPIPGTPEQFWAIHRAETEKWAKVIKTIGISAD
ncbi:MAG TPA: tripartite tricarboxylate transporter substrate binding protein [Ramlibacter sp.]